MMYKHTETGEVWTGAQSTKFTSNFITLSHEEKVNLGWELIEETTPSISLSELKKRKKQFIRDCASGHINLHYPAFKRENAALGIYGDAYKQELVDFINAVREKVDEYDVDIDSATKKSDLEFEVLF